jgi:hypothetical protein
MSTLNLAWFAATFSALGIVLIALSRPFQIEKLGAFGIEFKLRAPFENPGYAHLLGLGCAIFLSGIAFGVYSAYLAANPPRWPNTFAALRSAELEISEIDDLMVVWVNGKEIVRGAYGDTPDPADFKPLLHKGSNKIEVSIQNGAAGGCGGALVLRLNGLENPDFRWRWAEQKNMDAGVVCFAQTRTLLLR